MYATRLFQLLLVALSVVCVAQATWIDINKVHQNERRLVRRASPTQAAEPSSAVEETKPSDTKEEDPASASPTEDNKQTSAVETAKPSEPTNDSKPSATEADPAPETSAAEPDPATSAAAEPTNKATSKTAEKTSAKPAETAASSPADNSEPTTSPSASEDNNSQSTQQEAPATTSASDNSGNNDEDTSSSDGNNDGPSKTTEEKNTRTTAQPVTSTFIDVVTRTNSDGNLETMTTTSVTTSTPGLSSDGSDSSSGMSPKTRNTVIGVVVGVGGAIVVGALAVVAWRIWGRKKHNDEADGLMDFNETNNSSGHGINSTNGAYHAVEKTEPGSIGSAGAPGRSPFQATLDNYHQPTQVNASSNF
ncbi:hypothetical protein LCI18_002014 [Fusarium solani-melongenae]|uniref:Uncharacterized protein n=1 Tax=Fusarium solani subsp. cucurbitae TaxID=2747967 RepID=A0ACD3YQ46_FUSSC|nr:hypothetical protein LCI18_002014 [Fusarium solani-melongenae]